MKKTEAKHVVISEDQAGQRIDNFLHRHLNNIPKSRVYQMLRKGEVRVNKGRIKQTYRLNEGDNVRIPPLYQDEKKTLVASQETKDNLINSIIYEDEGMLVMNKPSGLAVHGGSGHKLGIIEALRSSGDEYWQLELVHRLDKETSGCLMFAKNLTTLRLLHNAIKEGQVKKNYTALLAGRMTKAHYRVDKPLLKNTLSSGERIVRIDPTGKNAVTEFTRERLFKQSTLVNIDLLTGRTHQIRVHSAYLNHPVLGDNKYGNRDLNREFRKKGLKRLFLHASALEMTSPNTGKTISINAPMDDNLQQLLDK